MAYSGAVPDMNITLIEKNTFFAKTKTGHRYHIKEYLSGVNTTASLYCGLRNWKFRRGLKVGKIEKGSIVWSKICKHCLRELNNKVMEAVLGRLKGEEIEETNYNPFQSH